MIFVSVIIYLSLKYSICSLFHFTSIFKSLIYHVLQRFDIISIKNKLINMKIYFNFSLLILFLKNTGIIQNNRPEIKYEPMNLYDHSENIYEKQPNINTIRNIHEKYGLIIFFHLIFSLFNSLLNIFNGKYQTNNHITIKNEGIISIAVSLITWDQEKSWSLSK